MDDRFMAMWNSLSLLENEVVTLNVEDANLIPPTFTFIGKLAIKKNVITLEVDKFLKGIWKSSNSMETTLVGKNTYLFSFTDQGT